MPPKASKKIRGLQQELELHVKQLARAVNYACKDLIEPKTKIAKKFRVKPTTLKYRYKDI